jgi:hypothetical protein
LNTGEQRVRQPSDRGSSRLPVSVTKTSLQFLIDAVTRRASPTDADLATKPI